MGDVKKVGGPSHQKVNVLKCQPVVRSFQLKCSTGRHAHMLNGSTTLSIGQKCLAVGTLRRWKNPIYCLRIFEHSLEHSVELKSEQIVVDGFASRRTGVGVSGAARQVARSKSNQVPCFYKAVTAPSCCCETKLRNTLPHLVTNCSSSLIPMGVSQLTRLS